MQYIIATDLDRTLLPNGNQEYDGSMPLFEKILKNEKIPLVFVTGRNLLQTKQAMDEFKTPIPNYIIGDVGTTIYEKKKNTFVKVTAWEKKIKAKTKHWNVFGFKDDIGNINGVRLQEGDKQSEFKLSYYVDDINKAEEIVKLIANKVKSTCEDATIIYSFDETHNIGLIDILPKYATKATALEFLQKKLKLKNEQIIYCGDSGNDLLPLTFGYKSIVVRNAIDDVKKTAKLVCMQNNCFNLIYFAKGYKKLNGYYVSGIIEGLIKFNVISESYATKL